MLFFLRGGDGVHALTRFDGFATDFGGELLDEFEQGFILRFDLVNLRGVDAHDGVVGDFPFSIGEHFVHRGDKDFFSGGCGEEFGDLLVAPVGFKNLFVDPRQEILAEAADRTGRPQNRFADAAHVERDERPVTLLDFDDAILNGHAASVSPAAQETTA